MVYLMTHSTHFIYGYMASDSERGNLLPPHGLLLSINSKGSFMHHPTDRITHTTAFVTPVVEHWLEREIAMRLYPNTSFHPSKEYIQFTFTVIYIK